MSDQYSAEEMEERLDNWGAWCRAQPRGSRNSALYKVLVAIGYQQENAVGRSSLKTIDAKDAELIDAAVRMVKIEPEHSWLVERFVRRRSGEKALQTIRGKYRCYTTDRAKRLVYNYVFRLKLKSGI